VSWRWEPVDDQRLAAWQAARHAPTVRSGCPDLPAVIRGTAWAAVLSTPLWAILYVAGRAGGVW